MLLWGNVVPDCGSVVLDWGTVVVDWGRVVLDSAKAVAALPIVRKAARSTVFIRMSEAYTIFSPLSVIQL